jgi:hypothetical protein
VGFESSVSDLDVALVFAEIAVLSDSPVTRSRNLANACNIYLQLRDERAPIPQVTGNALRLEARLRNLRSRLERLGKKFA